MKKSLMVLSILSLQFFPLFVFSYDDESNNDEQAYQNLYGGFQIKIMHSFNTSNQEEVSTEDTSMIVDDPNYNPHPWPVDQWEESAQRHQVNDTTPYAPHPWPVDQWENDTPYASHPVDQWEEEIQEYLSLFIAQQIQDEQHRNTSDTSQPVDHLEQSPQQMLHLIDDTDNSHPWSVDQWKR